MSSFEVEQPILNSPFAEPAEHWRIEEGTAPKRIPERRRAGYFYRDAKAPEPAAGEATRGEWHELELVNLIRERTAQWRAADYPGVTRTTLDLIRHWRRDGRQQPLFYAQVEAAETIIFLKEARSDLHQGIDIPPEIVPDDVDPFTRYACKMATGSGKTTVMGMLAAWSILNKVNDRTDGRFSDVVLIVCPNVTIRHRLRELDPELGEASLYRTRDLVPGHLMSLLAQGRVLVANWHVFEPQAVQTAGVSSKVTKAGVEVRTKETIHIGPKTTTARGTRYLTQEGFEKQVTAGLLTVIEEKRDKQGSLEKVFVESVRYVESDTSLINHVFAPNFTAQHAID